ncbi:hypothetical protein [Haliangium sp.]|uniref:hypothetical protein n=1 Tax=Haliangium sp. TaxID=2663208 RepID=UPI003D09F692
MSDMLDFFFRQRVRESELDLALSLLERADRNLAADVGIFGIIDGMLATERDGVPDLSIALTAPGRAYDQRGRRIFFGSAQVVDLSVDLNGVPTTVPTEGHERIVSLFVAFDRRLSDLRTDGNSQQVFFRRDEGFRFVVRQGAEAPAGQALPVPLQPDELLVVDVTRRFGQTQIFNADLRPNPLVPGDDGRRQRFVFAEASAVGVFTSGFEALAPTKDHVQAALQAVDDELAGHYGTQVRRHDADQVDSDEITGTPRALAAGTVRTQLAGLLGLLNGHESASSNAHAASAIACGDGPSWRDGTANPADTVERKLADLIAHLSDAAGARKVGAEAVAGSPNALDAGSVQDQLAALLAHANAHAGATGGAHPATAIEVDAGPAWRGGRTNPPSSLQEQLGKLVTDLGLDALGDDGALRVGAAATAGAPHALPAGSVRGQLDALLALLNRAGMVDLVNTWSARQVLAPADAGAGPALTIEGAASPRHLAFELAAGQSKVRCYHGAGQLEFTLNARWTGDAWSRDSDTDAAVRFTLRTDALLCERVSDVDTTFDDADWSGDDARVLSWETAQLPAGAAVREHLERDVSTGPLTGYSGVEGEWGSTHANIGGGGSFASGRLPAAPSSVTFSVKASFGVDGNAIAFSSDRMGVGWFASTEGALPRECFMFLTFSAT